MSVNIVILRAVYSFLLNPHCRALFLLSGTSANCICEAGAMAGNQVCYRTRPMYYTESSFLRQTFHPSIADDCRLFQMCTTIWKCSPWLTSWPCFWKGLFWICFIGTKLKFQQRCPRLCVIKTASTQKGWQKLAKCQFNLLPICLFFHLLQLLPGAISPIFLYIFFHLKRRLMFL